MGILVILMVGRCASPNWIKIDGDDVDVDVDVDVDESFAIVPSLSLSSKDKT